MTRRLPVIVLGVLLVLGATAAGLSPAVARLFENPNWPYNLGTMGTFLHIVRLAGLGLVVVGALGGSLERLGDRMLTAGDRWLLNGRNRSGLLLALLILLYISTYCGFTFYRHYSFNSTGWDLAIQDQVVWNTAQGRLFEGSLEGVPNYLGDHVQPYLAILGLAYVLISSPYVLLAFQTTVLALGAWPLFLLARRTFGSPSVGLVFALCLLAYPPMGYVNRFDFHIEVVVVPLMLAAIERIEAGHFTGAGVFMGLALFAKEEIGLTVAALALITAFRSRRWRFGLTWTAVGVVYALGALFVIIPAFRGAESDTLLRYAWLGETPADMVKTLIFHPGVVAENMIEPRRVTTLLQLLAPLAFVPLSGLYALVPVVPALAYNFLPLGGFQSTIYGHYMAIVIPFVFAAGVMGLHRWTTGARLTRLRAWIVPEQGHARSGLGLGVTLMILAVSASWLYQNPLLDDGKAPGTAWLVQPNDAAIRQGLAQIPDDDYVVTTNAYAPHLSHRRRLYVAMDATFNTEASAIFFNLRDVRYWHTCDQFRQHLEAAFDNGFGVTFHRDGVLLVQKHTGDAGALRQLLDNWPGCR